MSAGCFFVTYAGLPELDPDDQLAVEALRARGISAQPAIWNDPAVDWANAPLCILRSTWDYHLHYDAFMQWLDRATTQTRVLNAPDLVRWNGHKFYLRDLERAGVPVVSTLWLKRGEPADLSELLLARDWPDAIVKPAHGAATSGVLRVGASEVHGGQAHLDHLLRDGDVLVQPYLSSVRTYPERALVFIDGAYSHAVTKQAFQALLPAGEAGEAPVEATQQEITVASGALRAVRGNPLYARVDLVRDNANAICVLEVELIEPSLFLSMHPAAADTFAAAIAAL